LLGALCRAPDYADQRGKPAWGALIAVKNAA